MTTYVLRNGKLVEKRYARPKSVVQVVSDIAPYVSPVCDAEGKHPVIDGRYARREDLKRNDCREYDPGELRSFRKEVERHREEMAAISRDIPYFRGY